MYEKIDVQTVLIEITNACNLYCTHCYNSTERKIRDNEFMTLENIKYIIKKCNEYSLDKLYFSGGEPFTHPDILKIIDLCGEYPQTHFTITTNGLLLNEEYIKAMEQHENLAVQLSVDGLTKETYESMRGENTFDRFNDALNLLLNSKIKPLTARTCITRLNYKEVPYIFEYLYQKKIAPSFLFVNKMGNAEKNWEKVSLSMAQMTSMLNTINRLNNHYDYYATPPEPVGACTFTEKAEMHALLIKYTGDVAPCQFFYSHNIGNVFKQEIRDILNYNNLREYYELATKRKEQLENSESCKKCQIQSICKYGCIGMAEMMGDIMGVDGACYHRMITAACYSNGVLTPLKKEIKEDAEGRWKKEE